MISYSIGKSGMQAQQEALNVTANDLANLSTTGYKSKNIAFQELLANNLREENVGLSQQAEGAAINRGAKSAASGTNMTQGAFVSSESDFHVALAGEGFFGIQTPDGFRLTRDGSFGRNGEGTLVNAHGESVAMTYTVPANEWPNGEVTITDNGEVMIQTGDAALSVGRIHVYHAEQPATLQPAGRNQFRPDGQTISLATSGENGTGTMVQHMLEASNVNLAQTMVQLMTAQRAYSLSAKTLQTTDDMYSMINQFNRS